MTVYRRPDVDQPVFRGPGGAVIPYGRRWGAASPPEDTYSVTRRLARRRADWQPWPRRGM